MYSRAVIEEYLYSIMNGNYIFKKQFRLNIITYTTYKIHHIKAVTRFTNIIKALFIYINIK